MCELRLTDQLATGGLSFALQALFLPPDSPTQLQTVQFPYLDTWKVFKECGVGGVGGYSPDLYKLHDSAATTCLKTLTTYITVTVPAPDVQNSMANSFVKAWAVEATVWSGC